MNRQTNVSCKISSQAVIEGEATNKRNNCPLTHIIPPFVLMDPLVSFLSVADIARLSSTTKSLSFLMSDDVVWRVLQQRDFRATHRHVPLLDLFCTKSADEASDNVRGGTHQDPFGQMVVASRPSGTSPGGGGTGTFCSSSEQYKVLSLGFQIDQVRWSHQEGWQGLSAREGHDQVKLQDDTLFLRFGFTNDSSGWILDPRGPVPNSVELRPPPGNFHGINGVYGHKISLFSTRREVEDAQKHTRSSSISGSLGIVKSETLVQFGGSTAGGYQGMTSSLVVMTTDRSEGRISDAILNIPHTLIPGRAFHCQYYDEMSDLLYIHGGLLERGTTDNKLYTLKMTEVVKLAHEAADLSQLPAAHPRRREVSATIAACITELPVNSQLEPRFGHSMVAMGGGGAGDEATRLYIAGGYTGSGMFSLMDGEDLTSLWEYDTATQVYRCIVARVALPMFLGRCHAAVAYGPLIIYFGGTTEWSDVVTIFDTRTERLYQPSADASNDKSGAVVGRTSHCMTLIGTKMFVTGGCLRERPMFRPQVADLGHCVTRALRQLCPRFTTSCNFTRPKEEEEVGQDKVWSPPMCTPIEKLEDTQLPRPQHQQRGGRRFGARAFQFRSSDQEDDEDEDEDEDNRAGQIQRFLSALTTQGGLTQEQAQLMIGRLLEQAQEQAQEQALEGQAEEISEGEEDTSEEDEED